jgi:4-amino-4-deoxy-L-arabinose transferase-like glycosyltransferase
MAGVFLLSVSIILLFWVILPASFQQSDSNDYSTYYEPVARNILSGVGFVVWPNGALAISNPPGYSILLAGIFTFSHIFSLPESLVNSVFILLCMGFSSIFVFLLSEKSWGARGGWFSVLFFITYPFILWLTKQPNNEMPFMAAFYASLYLFWLGLKGHKNTALLLLLAGAFAGVAMLIRAIAIGTGFLLFGLFLVLKNDLPIKVRFLLALVLLLGNFLIVLPWQVWAYQQTGQVVLLGTNSLPSMKDGLMFAVESKNYRQKITIPADVEDLQNELVIENDSMNSFGDVLTVLGEHFVKEPGTVVKLFLIKAGRSWYATDSGSMESAIFVIQLFYGTLILLATIFVWYKKPNLHGLVLFVWGFVFYFWIMTTLVLSILRYMTPVIGLLALLIPQLINIISCRLALLRSR